MFFSGGLIPTFILIRDLGLYNPRLAVILPYSVGAWNLIISRVYIQTSIPDSLVESAKIDGASELWILTSIIVPLSKPLGPSSGRYYSGGIDRLPMVVRKAKGEVVSKKGIVLPPKVLHLCNMQAMVDHMTAVATMNGDRALCHNIIDFDLSIDSSRSEAHKALNRLLAAHADILPQFA